MITLHKITYGIGGRTLYDQASLLLKPSEKVGLVGANGVGKSTLFKLMQGHLEPSQGRLIKPKDCTIGYLAQEQPAVNQNDSIRELALQAFRDVYPLQQAIQKVSAQMEAAYSEALLEELTDLQMRFEQLGGYDIEVQVDKVLTGLGFAPATLNRPLHTFSGGWRMRVMLAKLLLAKPTWLLLDEPTNHLDLEAMQWVEKYLKQYQGGVLLISHDQHFLDAVTTRTIEVSNQQFHSYHGNYTAFLQAKAIKQALQQDAYLKQQKQYQRTKQFIKRFGAKASKAKQAQSRKKALAKVKWLQPVPSLAPLVKFNFPAPPRANQQVAHLANLTHDFGDNLLFRNTHLTVSRGDKIALIGANGRGKSTLLKLIAQQMPPTAGHITLGSSIKTSLYAQHQLTGLNVKATPITELQHHAPNQSIQFLRTLLANLGLHNDTIQQPIEVLSGGEKARVALAKTFVQDGNLMLLDEPTNHLDMRAIACLTQALQQYEGTFILVSHNRHFIEQVANTIWYLENHAIKAYPGTYAEMQTAYARS